MFYPKTKKTDDWKKGFTLFIAVVIMNLLILVAFAIINISLKEIVLSSSDRDSQFAFYAADSGIECALYWDNQIESPFRKPGENRIISQPDCNGGPIHLNIPDPGDEPAVSEFEVVYYANELNQAENFRYCARVEVKKSTVDSVTTHVQIVSKGYNTCSTNIPRRFERAISLEYDQ